MQFDYLIIGGGIAGTSAAETIRKNDSSGTIGIVSEEPYNLYSRIMLSKPNFFLGVVPFDNVWLRRDEWYAQNNISLLTAKIATKLDAKNKIVILDDLQEISYGKLLFTGGVKARLGGYPGADKPGVLYLRTLDDAKKIMACLDSCKKAVVVGGGFIGFEMCDMLQLAKIDVSIAIREKYYWEPLLDKISGGIIEAALKKNNVKILHDVEVQEILGEEKVTGVMFNNGKKMDCDIVIFGIGGYTEHNWLEQAGVKVNDGVLANEFLETNLPDVWTAGDSAEYKDVTLDEYVQLGNWVNAQQQGRIAGQNMSSKKQLFHFISFYTAQGMGITIAFVGDARPGPGKQVIARGKENDSHIQMIVRNNKIIGAVLINNTPELGVMRAVIEKKIDVSENISKLSESDFDLKKLM